MPFKDPEKARRYKHEHYLKNKEAYRSRTDAKRSVTRQYLIEAKDKPCADCSVKYPYYVMQFDHINTDKVADVSYLVRYGNLQQVMDEIAKCEVVCANCHAVRTFVRHQQIPSSPNG